MEKKIEELKRRYNKGEISVSSKKHKIKNMGTIQAYSSIKKLPSSLKKGSLFVDEESFAILVPTNRDQFVPFHISTINNVSKSNEGQWTYLRINFHTPSVGKPGALQFPDLKDPNALFVKELTLKNSDSKGDQNHLAICEKKIKDLIKSAKAADQENEEEIKNQKDE